MTTRTNSRASRSSAIKRGGTVTVRIQDRTQDLVHTVCFFWVLNLQYYKPGFITPSNPPNPDIIQDLRHTRALADDAIVRVEAGRIGLEKLVHLGHLLNELETVVITSNHSMRPDFLHLIRQVQHRHQRASVSRQDLHDALFDYRTDGVFHLLHPQQELDKMTAGSLSTVKKQRHPPADPDLFRPSHTIMGDHRGQRVSREEGFGIAGRKPGAYRRCCRPRHNRFGQQESPDGPPACFPIPGVESAGSPKNQRTVDTNPSDR